MSKGIIKLSDILIPQPKSKIKAGEGKNAGKYKFFTSSNSQTKFVDEYQYDGPALIFGTGGNANIHFCEEKFATSTDCLVFGSEEKQLLKSVYLYLSGNMQVLENGFKGAGLKHISKQYILDISFLLPEANEQRKIAAVLDRVSDLIAKRRQQLDKLDELVKSRFIEMFGNPKLNPNSYPISQLSEHIKFLTSGSRGWAQYCVDNGSEWFITIKNVKDCRISIDNMQPINAPDNAEAKRTKVQEGDLLISITADLGRTGVVTKEIADHGAYINQHLTCIRLNKEILNPMYVAFFMESPAGKEQFESKNQSAVKAGLNFNSINSLRLLVPPLELQNQFAAFVAQTDKSKLAIQKSLEKLEILKKALMQKYFG